MTDIVYPVRVKRFEAMDKGKEVDFAVSVLGKDMYALPIKGEEEEPMLLYQGVKSYCPRTGAVLTLDNMVFLDGVACDPIHVPDAFMVNGYGDYVMVTGRETVTYVDFRKKKVFQFGYGGRITYGGYLSEDITMIIMDGEVYLNMRQVSDGRRICSSEVKYYHIWDGSHIATTEGFIFNSTYIHLGRTPQKYYVVNGKAVVLVDGEILTYSSTSDTEFRVLLSDSTFEDIVAEGGLLFGLDSYGVCQIELQED